MIDIDSKRKVRRVDLGDYDGDFAGVVLHVRELVLSERLMFLGLQPGDSEDGEKSEDVFSLIKRVVPEVEGLAFRGDPVTTGEGLLEVLTPSLGKVVVKAVLGISQLTEAEAGNSSLPSGGPPPDGRTVKGGDSPAASATKSQP